MNAYERNYLLITARPSTDTPISMRTRSQGCMRHMKGIYRGCGELLAYWEILKFVSDSLSSSYPIHLSSFCVEAVKGIKDRRKKDYSKLKRFFLGGWVRLFFSDDYFPERVEIVTFPLNKALKFIKESFSAISSSSCVRWACLVEAATCRRRSPWLKPGT